MKTKTMQMLKTTVAILTLLGSISLPCVVQACPSCSDAPAQTGADENGVANAEAYNNSIYVMVGVPYVSFGIVGFMIFRGMKKNEEFRRGSAGAAQEGPKPLSGDFNSP